MRLTLVLLMSLASGATARADSTLPDDKAASGPNWQERFDLDGDGLPDPIGVDFSGGAHCCYRLYVTLSASHRHLPLPFELDGGYLAGLDLSRPENFAVRDCDGDGAADLLLHIATYAGRDEPIRREWRRRYGVRSHRIAIDLAGGRVRIENLR